MLSFVPGQNVAPCDLSRILIFTLLWASRLRRRSLSWLPVMSFLL